MMLFMVKATIPSDIASDHMKTLRADFPMSERARLAYAQVWP